MRYGHHANTAGVVGDPAGVTTIADLVYLSAGVLRTSLSDIATAGYAGVELFDGDILRYPGGAVALAAHLRELKLELVAVYTGANFIYRDVLPQELARIEEAAAVAARLGALHLVVGGGALRRGGSEDHDCEILGAALERVLAIAGRWSLTASFHPHLGTCAQTEAQIERLLGNTEICLCPDTAHLAAAGVDPAKLIRRHSTRINYVHLKDYVAEPLGFVPLGEGELDLRSVAQALADIRYDGWITVEADGFAGGTRHAAEASRRHLDVLFNNHG